MGLLSWLRRDLNVEFAPIDVDRVVAEGRQGPDALRAARAELRQELKNIARARKGINAAYRAQGQGQFKRISAGGGSGPMKAMMAEQASQQANDPSAAAQQQAESLRGLEEREATVRDAIARLNAVVMS